MPDLGTFGIWRPASLGAEDLPELEQLGFTTFWLGGSPAVQDARPFLEATSSMVVGTSILNVWQHEPAAVAAAHAELADAHPGRFLLGIGIGHPEATSDYTRPLGTMRAFFDGLAAAPRPVPREELAAAALGPKMLDLAAERSLGALPYFTPVEHTRVARERLGPDALLAVEVAVVVDEDADRARAKARAYAGLYLSLRNYVQNLLRLGFTEDDVAGGGSDRLIDAVVPHGSAHDLAVVVHEHLDAGADHVCLQPLGGETAGFAHKPGPGDPRALAGALGLGGA
jgi:probable F420-dependent oxidoreductase